MDMLESTYLYGVPEVKAHPFKTNGYNFEKLAKLCSEIRQNYKAANEQFVLVAYNLNLINTEKLYRNYPRLDNPKMCHFFMEKFTEEYFLMKKSSLWRYISIYTYFCIPGKAEIKEDFKSYSFTQLCEMVVAYKNKWDIKFDPSMSARKIRELIKEYKLNSRQRELGIKEIVENIPDLGFKNILVKKFEKPEDLQKFLQSPKDWNKLESFVDDTIENFTITFLPKEGEEENYSKLVIYCACKLNKYGSLVKHYYTFNTRFTDEMWHGLMYEFYKNETFSRMVNEIYIHYQMQVELKTFK